MRRGGGARPSLLPPPLCATPGLLWWSALRARAARPGGVRGLPRSRARPPSSGGRAGAALLRTVEGSRSPLVCGLPPLRSGRPCSLRAAAEPLRAWLAALALRGPLPRPFFRPGSAPGRPGARLRRAFTLGRPYAGGLLRGRPRCVSGASPTPFRPPPIRAGGDEGSRPPTGGDGD